MKEITRFDVPGLLKKRTEQKMKEMEDAALQAAKSVGNEHFDDISAREMKDMQEHDAQFFDQQSLNAASQKVIKKKRVATKMKGEDKDEQVDFAYLQYREVTIGDEDLLTEGKRCQINICDFNDETLFHPTEKIIIYKYDGTYFSTGSFCSYCYTDIGAEGVYLGDKMYCPQCCSGFDIKTGYVDEGPAMRGLSSFMLQRRDGKVQVILPENVPAF